MNGKRYGGSAYTYVLAVILLLSMLATAVWAVTASSREISAHYPDYSGVYELASGGNEQFFVEMRQEFQNRFDEIDAAVRDEILSGNITQYLVYRGGQFHLLTMEDGYYAGLFHTRAANVLTEYVRTAFPLTGGAYRQPRSISVQFAQAGGGDNERLAQVSGENILTDNYEGYTEIIPQPNGVFKTRTVLQKSVNGGSTGYPTQVEAEIILNNANRGEAYEELFIPSYTWRERPAHFSYGLYAAGGIGVWESGGYLPLPPAPYAFASAPRFIPSLDETLRGRVIAQGEPNIIDSGSSLDVSLLYDGDALVPAFVFLTGGLCEVFASNPARDSFTGVILCFGGLTVRGAEITGAVFSDGDILFMEAPVFSADLNMLFKIPISEPGRQSLFDYLRLTHFNDTIDGAVNIENILGDIKFDLEAENGTPCFLEINNFDGLTWSMVKSKKVIK
jgi:hypothetical protein